MNVREQFKGFPAAGPARDGRLKFAMLPELLIFQSGNKKFLLAGEMRRNCRKRARQPLGLARLLFMCCLWSSIVDVDGEDRADGCGLADLVFEFGCGLWIQKDGDAVFVPLVEYAACGCDALT